MSDDPFSFIPVPRKQPRHDGWTPERQRAFIAALAEAGSVSAAARTVGLSNAGAYALYNHPEGASLRTAWDAALACGVARLHDIAMERVTDGVPVPVFYRGEQVGEYRRFSEAVLLTLLRHHAFGHHPSPVGSASRAHKDRHAAENCPTCRARREAEAEPSDEERLAAAAELLHRYAVKVAAERRHRLAGEVVAADFTLRQITVLEVLLEGCGMADCLHAAWNDRLADVLHATPTDLVRELDAIKQQVWAQEAAPPRPIQNLSADAAVDTGLWDGPTEQVRDQTRRAARLRLAEAQAEWEACASEDSWARFRRLSEA